MIKNIFYIVFIAIILILSRVLPHPPNFTPIIASAIMAPILMKDRIVGASVPIIAMFISDMFLGFHPYQFVIYSTLLSISFFTPRFKKYLFLGLVAFLSSVWFFLTTNFAVWVLWDFYPKNIEGLISCYYLALPFFKNTILSTFFFTFLIAFGIKHLDYFNNLTNNFILKFIYPRKQ